MARGWLGFEILDWGFLDFESKLKMFDLWERMGCSNN